MKHYKTLLFLLLMLVGASFAHAQDRGWWVLVGTEVKEAPSFLTTREGNQWDFSPGRGENHYGDVCTWEAPPAKIAFGEENHIKISCRVKYSDSNTQSHLEAVKAAFKRDRNAIGMRGENGELIPLRTDELWRGMANARMILFPGTEGEWVIGTKHDYITPNTDYSIGFNTWEESSYDREFSANAFKAGVDKNSRMDIFIGNGPWYYYNGLCSGWCPTGVYYHYVYSPSGKVKEVTTGASSEAGEDDGVDIPWTYIIIGAVVAGGGAIAIGKGGKGKPKPQGKGKPKGNKPPKQEENEEEQEAKRQSSFRMVLYKDFGDTLVEGDLPKKLGARIEEITPDGQKTDRPDLTAKISIMAEENCKVSNVKMEGRYRQGGITALKAPADGEPGTAKVLVVFNGPLGALINHVVFKVVGAPEIVIPEALTFEAEGGKTQYIEFGINNYSGAVLGVKVTMEQAGAKYFTSQLVPDKENHLKYRINITERGKLPEPPGGQAQQQEKVVAGDAERFECGVKVQLEGRKEAVTAAFQLYRMHLGVRLDMHALKAYLVDYGSDWKHDLLATDPKRQKKWGESYTALKVFAEDKETGEIRTVIPDADPVFTFEDVKEGNVLFADRNGNIIQSVCDSVKFKYDFMEVLDDNTILGVTHSTVGGLLPPNRSKAKVTVQVSYNGKVYTDTEVVAVTSQPYRIINDEREYSRALKEDEEKLRHLSDLRYKIQCDPKFAELTPFYYKVDAMIDGYDARFGLYEPDYEKLMDVFDKYCRGEIGNYFVNETAWQPRWTLSEEYFNAFLATFGEMEKSTTGIATRIALGFFTAGASELVFTPLSATRHMKEYVDKGGDSAVKAFVIASADVLFWEGVFYVGGKAVKWGAGKAKDMLDNTATGQKIKELAGKGSQKLKEAYTKLKESVTQAKNGKAATKELASAKEYSTRQLSEQVKAGSEKVAQVKKASVPRANDAIRKTRMKGDAVYTQKSQLMEECSKQAREDAQQIIDNFKKVVNNPTASPEEVRRATLAIQGNKSAQNLLRNSPSDLLRANYNQNIEQIYKEVDGPTLKKLASRLKVADGDVRIGPQASGNAGADLYLGKKIAADRDVTYQVRDKFGKWVDIQEDIMEEVYGETFFEYYFGSLPANKQRALDFLKKFDQAVVNGATGLESYGDDLGRIINKELQTSKLIDPERVAQTFEHKCMEFINAGKKLQNEAEQLFLEGFEYRAKSLIGYGEELIQEGIRQNVKQFKRILDPRIQALVAKGVKGKDFSALYQKIRILEGLSVPPSKEVLPLASVEEARLVLKDQFNTTLEEVIKECASIIKEVNDCL